MISCLGATSPNNNQAKGAGATLIHNSTTSASEKEQMVSFGSIQLAGKHPFD